ncbi:hypothetical protein ACWNT8_06125 [Pigmentibacter ruber]|uniref:hypothetical protein n=1 Tax=Pigmentibacter ruber TaxID=2683196 RepID=UPI00131DF084|nr:hypothetical protein [Pigmentibacter ruber]BFD33162.1 hypothetical protein GTC16762_27800 [Pigmentibacter ruber]
MNILHFSAFWMLLLLITSCKNLDRNSSAQTDSPSVIQKNYSESIKQYEKESIAQDNNIFMTYNNIVAEKKANFQSDKNDVYIKDDQLVIDNFVIHKKDAISDEENKDKTKINYEVVYNKNTSNFGIITHTVIVKIQPSKNLILPNSTDYKVTKSVKNIGVYFIQFSPNISISKVKSEIEKANNIKENTENKVIIEIIELAKVNKPA